MNISQEDIQRHRTSGPWKQLEARAQLLVEDARRHGGDSFQPMLGGGTRLMLALNHRISDDVDLFVDSPAWLPYVSPRLNDMFESELAGYNEDNAHVKLRFAEGEIDFVVAAPLLPESLALWNRPPKYWPRSCSFGAGLLLRATYSTGSFCKQRHHPMQSPSRHWPDS